MTILNSTMCRAFAVTLVLFSAAASSDAGGRDRVGLVLAGGGARGIAHAGVIKALEEMQIPVDAIAGTSMGALVGGLYASGLDADALARVVEEVDWESAFEDEVPRRDLPPRRKSEDYDYPTQLNLAFEDGDLSIPLGIIQGQQVRQMLKDLMYRASDIRDFDQLPIPFRAVATDIETGEAFVFSEGDVVTAMRASMSLPALLAPVEYEGRLLVDGGMANNIPVDVARAMGTDYLLVVDIGTPLRPRDEIRSFLSVTNQVLGFLTRTNSLQQLETLTDGDVLLRPELDNIGMLDFAQASEIYQRGYDAAMQMRDDLLVHRLDDAAWGDHLASRQLPPESETVIAHVEIQNDSPISDAAISIRISQPLGEPLDRERLQQDLAAIYALDYWDIIDYEVLRRGAQGDALLIKASGRSGGYDRLKLGLSFVSNLDGDSEFNLGTSYLLKGINERGGEFYGRVQVGETQLLQGEVYQPLDLRSRYVLIPQLGYSGREVYNFGPEASEFDLFGSWHVREVRGDLSAALNLSRNAQFRLGLFRSYGDFKEKTSSGAGLIEDHFNKGGASAALIYDRIDNAFFPTQGAFLYGGYEANRTGLGADDSFERWQAEAQLAFTPGKQQRDTFIFTAKTGQSIDAPNEPQNYYQLGGLFNLSGLPENRLSGRQMAFAMLQYQRRLSGDTVIPLDMPVYAGFSLEGGQLWSDRSDVDVGDFISAGSIYLAVDSLFGPLYVAYGRTEDSKDAIYFALGWPFLNVQNQIRR